jgi:NAD(P)H-hydrate epimerase
VLVFTRRTVREVDTLAAEQYTIPSLVLMENAGLHLAEVALDLSDEEPARVLVVCGPGNNGGDGLCAARHLHNAGARVEVVLSGPAEACRGDARVNLDIVKRMGLAVTQTRAEAGAAAIDVAARRLGPEIVVDALLGTGLSRPVDEPVATLIRRINALGEAGAVVVSADLPSGLDCDTGEPLGVAVRADTTVSYVGLKAGFLRLAAQAYIGDVVVAEIGAPRELVERLGQRLADHEPHDGPDERPGHGGAPRPRRPGA